MARLMQPSKMTSDRLRELLDKAGLSQKSAGRFFNCGESAMRRFCRGGEPVPPALADWMEAAAPFFTAHPVPDLSRYYEDA